MKCDIAELAVKARQRSGPNFKVVEFDHFRLNSSMQSNEDIGNLLSKDGSVSVCKIFFRGNGKETILALAGWFFLCTFVAENKTFTQLCKPNTSLLPAVLCHRLEKV